MNRKSQQLNKLKMIGLRKKEYLSILEKNFCKSIKSTCSENLVVVPGYIFKCIFDELLYDFICGTGPIPKGIYSDLIRGDLKNEQR